MKKTLRKKDVKEFSEMVQKEFEIFQAGKYPQGEFGDAQLNEIVSTYNPKELHEAPQTIGHVSDYKDSKAPSAGWISSLKKVGNKLIAVGDFTEKLVSAVKSGEFKKRSIGLYAPTDESNPTPGKWHLHHVAWLGAQPPQVKGLADVAFAQFSEDREEIVDMEFADMTMSDMESMANEDTYQSIELEFAQCLAKCQEYLEANEDDEDKRQKIYLVLSDCYYHLQDEIKMHFDFLEKAESIVEKKQNSLKQMVEAIKNKLFVKK